MSKKGAIRISVLLICSLILSGYGVNESGESRENSGEGKYTVMIYMVGADLESRSACGTKDISEMLESGVDLSKVNVVVYAGGSNEWHAFGNSTNNYGYICGEGRFKGIKSIETSKNAENMGLAQTLSEFVNRTYKDFPSDHYALVLWDHGYGPNLGFGSDEMFGGDHLDLLEIEEALEETPFADGDKLDWMGFDACLMCGMEEASMFSKYADYMLASEEAEPVYGWDYSALSAINDTSDAVSIMESFARSYFDFCDKKGYKSGRTMSVLDLSKSKEAADSLEALYKRMQRDLCKSRKNCTELMNIRSNMTEFGIGEYYCPELVDMGSLAENMKELYPAEAEEMVRNLDKLVVFHKSDYPDSKGVSLYYPWRFASNYSAGRKVFENDYDKYSVSASQDAYLSDLIAIIEAGEPRTGWTLEYEESDLSHLLPKDEIRNEKVYSADRVDWSEFGALLQTTFVDPASTSLADFGDDNVREEADGSYCVILSPKQREELSCLTVDVFAACEYEEYRDYYEAVLTDKIITPDSNGNYLLDNPRYVFNITSGMSSETGHVDFWPVRQVGRVGEKAKYNTVNSSLEGTYGALTWTSPTRAYATFEEKNWEGEMPISSFNYSDEYNLIAGKNNVETEDYGCFSYYSTPFRPTYDENGRLRPSKEWEYSDVLIVPQIFLSSTPVAKKVSTAEIDREFVIRAVCRDIYGNEYSTGLLPLKSGKHEEYSEITGGLNCSYYIFDDHAELIEAEGCAELFTVPDEVLGKPVSYVGSGYGAVIGDGVEEIVIPGKVTIREYAFSGADSLKRVVLGEGIKYLSAESFRDCIELTEVELSNTLTQIGRSAFAGCESLCELDIPQNVSVIEAGAFERCYRLKSLRVDDNNRFYRVMEDEGGNVLFSADGKILVAAPGLYRKSYSIPEGTIEVAPMAFAGSYREEYRRKRGKITIIGYGLNEITFPSTLKSIGYGAFFGCNRFSEINLPDSLESVGIQAFGGTDLTGYALLDETKINLIENIRIGKNVDTIGKGAFGMYRIGNFDVDEENMFFGVSEGVLKNVTGTEEIRIYERSFGE